MSLKKHENILNFSVMTRILLKVRYTDLWEMLLEALLRE